MKKEPAIEPASGRGVVIIDSGGANIASLRFALERIGCQSILSNDPDEISQATHVILPGVGAAGDAMRRLKKHALDELVPRLTQPVLGICLGMQLLHETSMEGDTHCLGAIPGTVHRLRATPQQPVPHMGWNQLQSTRACNLLRNVRDGDYVYFVHSYAVAPGEASVAIAEYGEPFAAVVAYRNFFGTQFHPERSGAAGAQVLRNFLEVA